MDDLQVRWKVITRCNFSGLNPLDDLIQNDANISEIFGCINTIGAKITKIAPNFRA